MNRSFSKIRHIQESNQRIEKRFISEQFAGHLDLKKIQDKKIEDNMEMLIRQSKIAQIKAIIDNFDSINCDDYNEMLGDFMSVPEHVSIYCGNYRGKSKEEMIDILNNL